VEPDDPIFAGPGLLDSGSNSAGYLGNLPSIGQLTEGSATLPTTALSAPTVAPMGQFSLFDPSTWGSLTGSGTYSPTGVSAPTSTGSGSYTPTLFSSSNPLGSSIPLSTTAAPGINFTSLADNLLTEGENVLNGLVVGPAIAAANVPAQTAAATLAAETAASNAAISTNSITTILLWAAVAFGIVLVFKHFAK
jgi:hypothetical protein